MKLTALIDEANKVIAVLVCGSPAWAQAVFGGQWVDAGPYPAEPGTLPGIGYTYNPADGSFTPPPPPEEPPENEQEPTP